VAARGSKRRREALALHRGSWLLTSTLAVLLVLQYAYALGLPPSVYTHWGIMDGWSFRASERGYDVHGQLLCETCVRRKFYLYLRDCENHPQHNPNAPPQPIQMPRGQSCQIQFQRQSHRVRQSLYWR
jgi:hypothetical protein